GSRGADPEALLDAVDVAKGRERAAVVEEAAADTRIGRVQAADDLAQGPGLGRHLGRAARVGPQDRRDPDGHAHNGPAPSNPAAGNAASGGLVAAGTERADSTASSVFRPSPELMITVSASGSSCPVASSLRSTPTVTPPAVSPKMPWVRASSRIESTISGSETSATAPPVRRTTSSTYG